MTAGLLTDADVSSCETWCCAHLCMPSLLFLMLLLPGLQLWSA